MTADWTEGVAEAMVEDKDDEWTQASKASMRLWLPLGDPNRRRESALPGSFSFLIKIASAAVGNVGIAPHIHIWKARDLSSGILRDGAWSSSRYQ